MEDAPQGAEADTVLKGEEMLIPDKWPEMPCQTGIVARERSDTLRRQIIIIKANQYAKGDELMRLRDKVLEQMKDGVIILPNTVTVMVADADALVVK
jgi:hypothetical protein